MTLYFYNCVLDFSNQDTKHFWKFPRFFISSVAPTVACFTMYTMRVRVRGWCPSHKVQHLWQWSPALGIYVSNLLWFFHGILNYEGFSRAGATQVLLNKKDNKQTSIHFWLQLITPIIQLLQKAMYVLNTKSECKVKWSLSSSVII